MSLRFLTDFADGAVLLPIGIAVAVVLASLREWRTAAAWVTAVGGTWAAIVLLKLVGYAVAIADPASPLGVVDLVTPSGHVASATVIYAGLIGLLLDWPGRPRTRIAVAAPAVAVAVSITRVVLQEHTVAEVVIGAAVGLAGAAALATCVREPLTRWRPLPVLAVVAAILLVRHGEHSSWEGAIHEVAQAVVG